MTAHDRPNLPPEPWPELLAGYVLGDLSSVEMTRVQQYLAAQPEAQAEVAELQATLNLLPLSLADGVAPPAALQAQLLRAAGNTTQRPQAAAAPVTAPVTTPVTTPAIQPGGPAARQGSRAIAPRPVWRSLPRAVAIAAIAAAALLGWQNLQLRSALQLARQDLQFAQQRIDHLAAIETQLANASASLAKYQEIITLLRLPENRLLALRGASGFTQASSGSIVIAPQKSWAILTLKGLPQPPRGKAYQLWAVVNGQKVYCAEFKPDPRGQVLLEIPVENWAGTPMVSITLEDEGTIPAETSEMVINGTVI